MNFNFSKFDGQAKYNYNFKELPLKMIVNILAK